MYVAREQILLRYLSQEKWNIERAALAAEIDPSQFRRWMRQHNMRIVRVHRTAAHP